MIWVDVHRLEANPVNATARPNLPALPTYQRGDRDRTNTGIPLLDAFPVQLWAVMALLFAGAVLLALARARRLGPPVPEPLPVLVPASEAVTGRGRLYEHINARDASLAALRAAAIARIVRVLDPTASAASERQLNTPGPALDRFVSQVAARVGRSDRAVWTVLYGPSTDGRRRPGGGDGRTRPARLGRGVGPSRPGDAAPDQEERRDPHRRDAGWRDTPGPLDGPEPDAARAALGRLRAEIGKVIIGQDATVTGLVLALLCRGHVLLEGVPGVAKTLLVRALAASLSLEMKRMQFTPDLMPSDITGSLIFDARAAAFEFRPGPVFTNLFLADEINRTPPKTQASLLEGDGGAAGIGRGSPRAASRAVPGRGDPEPDRVRGDLSTARGAAGPLPASS